MSLSPVRDGLSTVPVATQQLTALSNCSGAFDPAQRAYTSATEDLQNVLEPQERLPAVRPNRNFRHFKNPPQPHMCIKDSTRSGEDLYINVMSWTRIVMPVSAEEPIPLYGGMKVPAGIRGSAAQVYAVMANPEILKHVGRNCEDVEEKHALVELMSDFVEAMNPGLTLTRRAEILKDRDLSGELKDIWSAVQAKRERDKDGFPQSFGVGVQSAQSPSRTLIVEFGPASAPKPTLQQNGSIASIEKDLQAQLSVDKCADISLNEKSLPDTTLKTPKEAPSPDKEKTVKATNGDVAAKISSASDMSTTPSNVRTVAASITNGVKLESSISAYVIEPVKQCPANGLIIDSTQTESDPRAINEVSEVSHSPTATPPASTPPTSTPPTSTKKEKIGGFLPNGCHNIFPFIKSKSSNSKKDKKQKSTNVVDVSVSGGAVTQLSQNTKVPAVELIKTAASGLNNGTAVFDHHSPLMMTTASSTKLELANINPDYIDMVKNMQLPADACVDKMKKLKL